MDGLAPPGLRHLRAELAKLDAQGLLRTQGSPLTGDAATVRPSFCSNDYLGLAAGLDGEVSPGSGASRLVAGEHAEHGRLERALSEWLDVPRSLLFTSGYAANLGTISALACSADDRIISDSLNHASVVDGCRLAKARTHVVPHLDLDAVRALLRTKAQGRTWVVTESYFSMDADSPDLVALRSLCDDFGAALMVDEAHALGVFGPEGRGLCAAVGITPDVLVGTLGKSFGAAGAFVAGCDDLVAWLWNRARSFVFSTGVSPLLASRATQALTRVRGDEAARRRTLERAEQLRHGLARLGIAPLGHGHVVPWVLGEAREALRVASSLRERGFLVQAIRPPTVPPGSARLRFTTSARQSAADVEALLSAVADSLA